jgi:predicted nucleic acid-binding protein
VNYLDANFVAALHFNIPGQTPVAERFVRKNSLPFVLSELAELECRRAFIMRTSATRSENWSRLQSLVLSGAWRRVPLDWRTVLERSHELVDRFGPKLKAGTLDTLHVGHALVTGCTRFLSFDSNSLARVLAASCRLKVFPDLTPHEKGRMAG